ncbi:maestro heat-like repeat-containing protein family member 7 [Struthio camelus]|uniref:maestro heat-like repeat-containing protein family member 7 n=6 Tax=Struthio camelus TaxID=8801 RepID=UPI003603C2E0
MAERPPSRPRVAWEQEYGCPRRASQEQDRVAEESSSASRPLEGFESQAWRRGARFSISSWSELSREDEEALDFIQAFVGGREQQEAQKLKFLASIGTLCGGSSAKTLSWGLEVFCCRHELAEHIEVLLEEEPLERLGTAVRQQAMLAITAMSAVEPVLEGKKSSLLHACFKSVFLLPPREDMETVDMSLYSKTLDAMDNMLEVLVLKSATSSLLELQKILQMLLPFTKTERAAVRERAVGRIGRLSKLLANYSSLEVWHPFGGVDESPACYGKIPVPMLGQLVGCLILCCAYEDAETKGGALDALHCLFRFVVQRKRRAMLQDDPEYVEPQKEREADNELCLSWTSNMSVIMRLFVKNLQPSERTDVIVTAIEGMRNCSTYNTEVASHMLTMFLLDAFSVLEDVPRIIRCLYRNVKYVRELSARVTLNKTLCQLACLEPSEVTVSLLYCSPLCNSTAVSMWKVLMDKPMLAPDMLRELLSLLEERPLRKQSSSDRDNNCILPLAATRALCEIIREPVCPEAVKAFFPQLFLALLLQMVFTAEFSHQEANIFLRECQRDESRPTSHVRCAVQAMKSLLRCTHYETVAVTVERKGGWDLFLHADTSQKGVVVLARAMRGAASHLRRWIFRQLARLLRREDQFHQLPVMAFFVELLECPDLADMDEEVLPLVQGYAQSESLEMRRLAFRGLVALLNRPKMKRRMQSLLPDSMEWLQDACREVRVGSLMLLRNILSYLEQKGSNPIVLQLAEKLLPRFDDEDSRVRELSMLLFKDLLEIVVGKNKRNLKQHAQRSLVPLFLHMSDKVQRVAQASQEALVSAAQFLKWEELKQLARRAETWKIGECVLLRDRSRAEQHLRQSLPYLENPDASLREAAVRFIALQPLENDAEPLVRCLVSQTIMNLRVPRRTSRFHLGALCPWLPRAWARWHPPART